MNVGNVLVSLLSTYLMDRAGRKILLLASNVGMIIGIVALTIALAGPKQDFTAGLATASVVTFVASFGIGFGPIPWLLPAELFAMDKIAKGAAIAATSNWLANFVVGQTFPFISGAL